MKPTIKNPAYMITDKAWDELFKLYRSDAAVFERALGEGGLRNLCRDNGINPDA